METFMIHTMQIIKTEQNLSNLGEALETMSSVTSMSIVQIQEANLKSP